MIQACFQIGSFVYRVPTVLGTPSISYAVGIVYGASVLRLDNKLVYILIRVFRDYKHRLLAIMKKK